MGEFIRIDLGREASPGIFEYTVPSLLLCGRSRQPLLDACRQIKSMGGDPEESAGLFRQGRDTPDLFCTVGKGADTTVSEPDRGTISFQKYRPFKMASAAWLAMFGL